MKKNRSFTLLELLVVIAIIGLLSSIIFVSLGFVRARAQDVSIEAHLAQIRTASQMYITEHGNYSDLFHQETEAKKIINALKEITEVIFRPSSQEYCVQAKAKTSGFFCLDNTGRIGKGTCVSNLCVFDEEEIIDSDPDLEDPEIGDIENGSGNGNGNGETYIMSGWTHGDLEFFNGDYIRSEEVDENDYYAYEHSENSTVTISWSNMPHDHWEINGLNDGSSYFAQRQGSGEGSEFGEYFTMGFIPPPDPEETGTFSKE